MQPLDIAEAARPPPHGVAWRERWLAQRDALLASPRFRRWAAAFPFTRRTAQRRARALFDLVAGFVYSQVLLACVRLRAFDVLAEGPQDLRALALRFDLTEDAAERLLDAAVSLGLAERRRGGRYGLGPLGAPMVGNHALAAMVEHHAALYADLSDPVALLRGDDNRPARLSRYWAYASAPTPDAARAADVADYSTLMAASQPLVAEQILDAYPLARHQCLLDVGGGEGAFLAQAAQRTPRLRLMLFDLPAVAARARARLAAQGLGDRAVVAGGDFLADPLPTGADIVTLIRVVHDHDDAPALALLKAVRAALPAHGCLLLAEPMAGTRGQEPMGDAYFGFYLLAMGQGRPRTAARLTQMLQAAGFARIRILPTRMPLQTSLILAQPGVSASRAD